MTTKNIFKHCQVFGGGGKITLGCEPWSSAYQDLTVTFWEHSFKVTHSHVCLPEHSRRAGCVPCSRRLSWLVGISVTLLPRASLPSWRQPLKPLLVVTNDRQTQVPFFILTVFIFLLIMSEKQITKTTEMKRVWTKASRNRNQLQLAGVKGPRSIYVMHKRLSPAGPPSDWKWVLGSGQKPKRLLPQLLPEPRAFSSPLSAFTFLVSFRTPRGL